MIRDALALALRAIRRNAMRSTLTMLGIVIGVAAVIAMVTLGRGTTERVTSEIGSLGSNVLIVMPGGRTGRGPGGIVGAAQPFTLRDVSAIAEEVSGIAAIAPVTNVRAQAVLGNANWPTTITGTDNGYFALRDWPLSGGRVFTDAEQQSGRAVCIIGSTVRRDLFGNQDPLGSTIRLRNLACEVVGTLAGKGQAMGGQDQDDVVIMPIRAVQRRLAGNQDVSAIQISVRSSSLTGRVQQDLNTLLRERRRIATGADDDFRVMDIAEIASAVASTTRALTLFLSALAAVSLLVGGIGIMNIMLVSVTERTREIGIRLAVGAMERDVLSQFLVEAIVLALIGGIVGIAIGLGGSYFAVPLLDIPFVADPAVVLIAFGFSGAVGIVFGFFPARKAARLDPIDALRHE